MKIEDLTTISGMLEELHTIKRTKPPIIGFKTPPRKSNEELLKEITRIQTTILDEKINILSKKVSFLTTIKRFFRAKA